MRQSLMRIADTTMTQMKYVETHKKAQPEREARQPERQASRQADKSVDRG